MGKNGKRLLAGLMICAMLLAGGGSAAVFAAETTAKVKGGQVLTITPPMLDKNGMYTVPAGKYDKIVVAKEVGAYFSKVTITLDVVVANEVVVESGMDGTFEVNGGSIGKFTVTAIRGKKPSLRDLAKALKSGRTLTEAKQDYTEAKAELKEQEAKAPTIVAFGDAQIDRIELAGNANLNLKEAKVEEVVINMAEAAGSLKAAIENFAGNMTVKEETVKVDDGKKAASVTLKDSTVKTLNIEGSEAGSFVLEGEGSKIANAVVNGNVNFVLGVETGKVSVTAKSTDTLLVVVADVGEVLDEGKGTSVVR